MNPDDLAYLRKSRNTASSTSSVFVVMAGGLGIGREVAEYFGTHEWNIPWYIPLLLALLAIYFKLEHMLAEYRLSRK